MVYTFTMHYNKLYMPYKTKKVSSQHFPKDFTSNVTIQLTILKTEISKVHFVFIKNNNY